ncbi:MAG: lysophospholipid acyltransferase family protein [Phycisphaeraceae bacterium JB051]
MAESSTDNKTGNWNFKQLCVWYFVYVIAWTYFKVFYRFRIKGMHNIPKDGPILFVCNHQSYLDPLIIGVGSRPRPFISLARKTLFRNRYFGWLIRTLRAIPVDQEAASDLTAMRNCIEVLKGGDALLVFAEGSRTYDGYVSEFANGVAMLMKRAKPTIIPVAIEGAFDVWPRMNKKPKAFGRMGIAFGKARRVEDVLNQPVSQAMESLHQEIQQMCSQMRSEFKLPALLAESSKTDD